MPEIGKWRILLAAEVQAFMSPRDPKRRSMTNVVSLDRNTRGGFRQRPNAQALSKEKRALPLLEQGILRTKPSEISTHKLHIIVLRSWIPRAWGACQAYTAINPGALSMCVLFPHYPRICIFIDRTFIREF